MTDAVTTFAGPDPVGPLMVPMARLADVVAASARFRTLAGVPALVTQADAAAWLVRGIGGQKRIFFPGLEDYDFLRQRLPVCVIQYGGKLQWTKAAGGALNYLRPSGTFRMIFADRAADRDEEIAARQFGNDVGTILGEIAAQAADSNKLAIDDITAEGDPQQCTETEEDSAGFSWFRAAFLVSWS